MITFDHLTKILDVHCDVRFYACYRASAPNAPVRERDGYGATIAWSKFPPEEFSGEGPTPQVAIESAAAQLLAHLTTQKTDLSARLDQVAEAVADLEKGSKVSC